MSGTRDEASLPENKLELQNGTNVLQSMIRASISALFTFFTHPLDLKNSRDVINKKPGNKKLNTSVPQPKLDWYDRYFKGFKSGFLANLARSSILFGSMPILQEQVSKRIFPQHKILVEWLSFVLASMMEGIVWSPVTYAKQRLALDNNKQFNTYYQVYKKTPPHVYGPAIVNAALLGAARNGLFSGLFFALLKASETAFLAPHLDAHSKLIEITAFAIVIGGVVSNVTYPVDRMAKEWMQFPDRSLKQIIKQILAEEGVKGLWRESRFVPLRTGIQMSGVTIGLFGASKGYDEFKKYVKSIVNSTEATQHLTAEEEEGAKLTPYFSQFN